MSKFTFEVHQVSGPMGWVHPVNRIRVTESQVASTANMARAMLEIELHYQYRAKGMGQFRIEQLIKEEAA